MKRICIFKAVFSLILSTLLLQTCQQKDREGIPHLKTAAVLIAENGPDTLFGNAPEIKEEFRITESDPARDDYLLVMPISIGLDELGNIYVLDIRDSNIKVFDKLGRFLRIIGRKGNGPGEFDRPSSMDVLSNAEIVVLDSGNRRVTFCRRDGRFLRDISIATISLSGLSADSHGNLFGFVDRMKDGQRFYELQKFDANMNWLSTMSSVRVPAEPGNYLFFPSQSYFIAEDDLIFYGYPVTRYDIEILDNKGKPIRRIIKSYSPVRISADETSWIRARQVGPPAVIAEHYPPYIRITGDDEGRIIAFSRLRKFDPNRSSFRFKECEYDFFDQEGQYLASKTLPYHTACLWKGGKLYTIEEDDLGLPLIRVSRVTWKGRG